MGSKYEQRIYETLTHEPMTPSEIAKKVRVTYKTAQRALMHLALTRDDVAYRNSGRINLFWRVRISSKGET